MKNLIYLVAGLLCFSFEIVAQTNVLSNPFQVKDWRFSKHNLEGFVVTSEMEGGSGITTNYLIKPQPVPPFSKRQN